MLGNSKGEGILWLISVPLCLPSLLVCRMWLELTIVLFRIETHLRTIREHYEKK